MPDIIESINTVKQCRNLRLQSIYHSVFPGGELIVRSTELNSSSFFPTLSGGEGRVHPSAQPAGQHRKEEESSGAGE